MNGRPAVSIVMPFLDVAEYIRESVESVQAQRFDDWELLLVDDGSTDGSKEIAQQYASLESSRIRVLESGHGGPRGASAARNVGIAAARGEFLALLDADDVWLPEKLSEHVPLLAGRSDTGMLYGDTLYWHSWSNEAARSGEDFVPPLGVQPHSVIAGTELLAMCTRGFAAVPCTCSLLVRTNLVREVGGFDERFTRVYTDQAFYAKVLLRSKVYIAPGCYERYRIHANSSVQSTLRAGELMQSHQRYLDWLLAYLESEGLGGSALWKVVRRERRWFGRPSFVRTLRRRLLVKPVRRVERLATTIGRILRGPEEGVPRS